MTMKNPFIRFLLLALIGLWHLAGHAGSIEAERGALLVTEEGYALAADFKIDLGPRVEEALNHGVTLHFKLEFELTRSRWYWAAEHVAGLTLNYRLYYTPLTRQYRLGSGSFYRNFDTLEEALRTLSRVTSLPVGDKSLLKSGEAHQAAVRLSLDRSQLPKPLQLDAIGNRDWDIMSKTYRWQPAVEGK